MIFAAIVLLVLGAYLYHKPHVPLYARKEAGPYVMEVGSFRTAGRYHRQIHLLRFPADGEESVVYVVQGDKMAIHLVGMTARYKLLMQLSS